MLLLGIRIIITIAFAGHRILLTALLILAGINIIRTIQLLLTVEGVLAQLDLPLTTRDNVCLLYTSDAADE